MVLLSGWVAFWLVAALTSYCDSFVARAQAAQEPATARHGVHAVIDGEPAGLTCPGLDSAHAAPGAAGDVLLDSGWHPEVLPGPVASAPIRPLVGAAQLGWSRQRPPPLAFHQRTARRLI
jgi:hypothetical protein